MRFFKTTSVLLLCILLTMMIAACGGSDGSTNGKATVSFMTWESAATNAAIDAALKKFSDSNITIQHLPSPSADFDQKITSLTTAKQLPNFFWCGNDTEQSLGQQCVLFDWSSYASKTSSDFDKNNFAASALKNWYTPDGKALYGLPTLMNTYGYFYNADLLTAANVSLPKAGWSYDDLIAAAKALTKKDGDKVTQYGAVGGPYTDPFLLGNYSASAGGSAFTDRVVSPTKVIADAKFVEAVQKFVPAIKEGDFTPLSGTGGDTTAGFLAGKIPMLWGGQWLAAGFLTANPSFKIGFAPMPVVNKVVQPYDAVGICSPSYIKNPDAVWKVMTYLDTVAWKDILPGAPVAPAAYVPASSTYFDTLNSKGLSSVTDSVKYVLDAPDKDAIRFLATWSAKANDVVKANWNDIITGQKPAEATLNSMVKQINDIIQQNQ